MDPLLRLLLVGDDENDALLVERHLPAGGLWVRNLCNTKPRRANPGPIDRIRRDN